MSKTDKAFLFSPGDLGKFLREFARARGLVKRGKPNVQEATRQIIRERMLAEQQAQG